MSKQSRVVVFGEVLFDCFPSGERILGGAPFNVAWHLQAFGQAPVFVSRVGVDSLGKQILNAMKDWQMDVSNLQIDRQHPTGKVEVTMVDNEPHYQITSDCAYDFIEDKQLDGLPNVGILYHGTLGLRNPVSRKAFLQLVKRTNLAVFLDVNLRAPWWQKADVYQWLKRARWVKLNVDELRLLGFMSNNLEDEMSRFLQTFDLEQVILTRGEAGAMVHTDQSEYYHVVPSKPEKFIDTVGAGDAFTSVYLHGLLNEWPIAETLDFAQQFASKIIGLRGATTPDKDFYQQMKQAFHL